MGTNEAFLSSVIRNRATARGPASFFRGAFRSPGLICGRSSCPAAIGLIAATHASTSAATTPRCKLLKNLEARGDPPFPRFLREGDDFSAPLVLGFNFSGEISMHINDKAP